MTAVHVDAARGQTRRDIRVLVSCQRGAMTIDWVALSASMLLLAVAVVYGIYTSGVGGLSGFINTTLIDAGKVGDTDPKPGADTFR